MNIIHYSMPEHPVISAMERFGEYPGRLRRRYSPRPRQRAVRDGIEIIAEGDTAFLRVAL